uniref:Uncharacterized protein n=1 Tax=Glossina brevipalpis TaxID=37001 RepID=A0A1A9WTF3_9MUSC
MNNLNINGTSGLKKNFKLLRHWCICAGTLGLFQSLTWIALCIIGILSYKCMISVNEKLTYGSLLKTVFMELYFKGNCTPLSYPTYNTSILQNVENVLSVKQILIWNCVYLAVAICWCITSTWMLIIIKTNEHKAIIAAVSTWIAVMLSIIIMDFALAIIFGIDYGRFKQEADKWTVAENANAAQLFAGMVASITMMILSLKGFILWLINVAVLTYLIPLLMKITNNNKRKKNWFEILIKKSSSDNVAIRPPIQAYKEDEEKNNGICSAFTNNGYEPDNNNDNKHDVPVITTSIRLNEESLARAARLSAGVSIMERRFYNIEAYQQYPPRSRRESSIPEEMTSRPESPATFPPPDYTPPPITKSNHNNE